jgi:hypothetical protein
MKHATLWSKFMLFIKKLSRKAARFEQITSWDLFCHPVRFQMDRLLLCRNKKQRLQKRHHHKMNLTQPLNCKLLRTVHLAWNVYCHCLQPKDHLVQGHPAMDGLVKSPGLRVNQRIEKYFLMYQKTIYQILWKLCLLRGSDQVDGMCALTGNDSDWPQSSLFNSVLLT